MNNKTMIIQTIMAGRRKRLRRWLFVTILLILLMCTLCCAMLIMGNTIYPVSDVIRALLGEQINGVSFTVNTLRLPRMLAGLFAGFAFGLAGNTFQTLLRNPLASPDIIGITAGSSAGAVFCILILQTSAAIVSVTAVIAGLVTVSIIYILSRFGTFSIGRLILIGIGIQAMLNSVVSYLLLVGAQQDIPAAIRWLSGSLNDAQMSDLAPLVLAVFILAPVHFLLGRHLRILELGEQSAVSLGLNTEMTRIALILSAVCMLALATATTGPIAFVAFLSGPIAKRLVGVSYSTIIPAGLVGVNLVLAADLIGQFAFVARYPVGVITGILGAPYLIFLLIRMNRKGSMS